MGQCYNRDHDIQIYKLIGFQIYKLKLIGFLNHRGKVLGFIKNIGLKFLVIVKEL